LLHVRRVTYFHLPAMCNTFCMYFGIPVSMLMYVRACSRVQLHAATNALPACTLGPPFIGYLPNEL
jgi:hypothetical protein